MSASQPDPLEPARENPYAPPKAEIGLPDDRLAADWDETVRRRLSVRAAAIRVAGRTCFAIAGLVLLTFGGGTISQLVDADASGRDVIAPWMHRRWVARMACVLTLAAIAAVASWGLSYQRNWARWALALVAALPVPVLFWGWILLATAGKSENPAPLNPMGLASLTALWAVSSPGFLYLLWSRGSAAVFSEKNSDLIASLRSARAGFPGTLLGLGASLAILAAFFVLLFTLLLLIVGLGIIVSI
jgi:hypothetical protein